MRAVILMDEEYQTKERELIYSNVKGYLTDKGFELNEKKLQREELAPCMGCFGCWIKTPGECVIHDDMAKINLDYIQCDVVIYLCPVVFGQCSANIKNALDRWLPNVLPFFEAKPDGNTTHPARYETFPKQIMIAYADQLSQEDAMLFTDIIKKHRRDVEVIIYNNSLTQIREELDAMELKREVALL